jgi:phosphoglycolate phosphatase-like HAD superfamily hydrolase
MNLVIFDVDGTLLDNLACEDACYAAALRERLGLVELDTDWRTYEHVSDEGIAVEAYQRAFGVAPTRAQLAATVDRFLTLLADAHGRQPLSPIPGAAMMLAALPAHGWRAAFATGAWGRAARFKLAAAGLAVDALPLASAEDGPARVAIVRAAHARAVAAAQHSTSGEGLFERVVLVGDGVWDVATARALEMPFVGRAEGAGAAQLRASGAGAVFSDFRQLGMVLTALESALVPQDSRRRSPST